MNDEERQAASARFFRVVEETARSRLAEYRRLPDALAPNHAQLLEAMREYMESYGSEPREERVESLAFGYLSSSMYGLSQEVYLGWEQPPIEGTRDRQQAIAWLEGQAEELGKQYPQPRFYPSESCQAVSPASELGYQRGADDGR